jgi:hypothetical protein
MWGGDGGYKSAALPTELRRHIGTGRLLRALIHHRQPRASLKRMTGRRLTCAFRAADRLSESQLVVLTGLTSVRL